jgi:hypothetical protein
MLNSFGNCSAEMPMPVSRIANDKQDVQGERAAL